MIKSIPTPKGNVVIRDANLADAEQFRALRLFALQESPTAFSADYQVNLKQPMSFWEGRLTSDEYGVIFLAEHN
ncbi:MAG: hypothetical protein HGA79_09885, partial [Anaerolineales bacterium]|nr:hypothetical protein [Anaerolineales bacterium]